MGRISAGLCLCVLCFVSAEAGAQDGSAPSTRRIYTPAEFDRFAPRSALDMVRQIPGFVIREGGGDRGFGQADTNVLINGQRISGKSNGPVEALGRITAEDVVRLEIVDGASLDIGGLSGQVLNVITSSGGGVSGRFRYSPQFRSEGTPFRWGDAEISASGGGLQSEWTLSLRNEQERFGDAGPEFVFDGNGDLIDSRQERRNENFDIPGLSGSFTRTAANGNILNLTGETNGFILRFTEISERDAGPDVDRVRVLRETEDEFNFEVGADYEFDVPGGRLKLIGLYRYENSPTVGSVRFDFADDRPPLGSVFTQQANEAEAILRTEYVFGAPNGDWQWSLEGTRNFLDIEAELEQRDANGALQPVAFPGSSSRVEEDRAETTLSYGRSLSSRLQLQSSLGIEYSQISQTGEFGLVRDFVRPKGFVSLNWKPLDSLNISAKLERVVGQLNFFDFIASVNINQERVNVTNVNLVPPQSWLLELELQQSLGGFGTATLSGFAEDVTDIVDLIPIDGGGQAPGNIDSATRFGASADLTLLSDPLGWRGARLDLAIDYNDSEVVDPLLGTPRRISDRDYFDVEATFRQDFPNTDWAAGVTLSHEENSPLVRLDEVSAFQQSFPFGEVFIENKNVFGLTVRATVGNAFDRDNDFFRTIFNNRLSDDIAFQEERFRNFGTIFTFDIEGNF
ncbi:MAG: TonB-dependent receptor plug domain-containing protein [Pseudomonadota bacterium]